MMLLPQQVTFPQLLTKWASILNPLLSNPVLNTSMLQNVSLTSGNNVVNHKLGRNLQGWYITRIRGVAASIYDTQDTNHTPSLTLNLNASTAVIIDLVVF